MFERAGKRYVGTDKVFGTKEKPQQVHTSWF